MLLAVDIGNSNIVWGLYEQQSLQRTLACRDRCLSDGGRIRLAVSRTP